jgi:hypothetical protein
MAAGDLAVWIGWRCFDLAPKQCSELEAGSVNAFRLTMRAADVGESARFVGMFLNYGGFPFLSLILARRS